MQTEHKVGSVLLLNDLFIFILYLFSIRFAISHHAIQKIADVPSSYHHEISLRIYVQNLVYLHSVICFHPIRATPSES